MHQFPPGQEHNHVIIATKELRNPARRDTEGGVALRRFCRVSLKYTFLFKYALFPVQLMLFFFFKHLNSLLMLSSCVNSESSFLSISLLRRNSNAKALRLCVCFAVFVGFSSMNFTSLNAHQRMWVGEKKQCWGLGGVEKKEKRGKEMSLALRWAQ